MRSAAIAAGCIALLACALMAGCTSPTQAEINPVGGGTTVETTVSATIATTAVPVTTTAEPVVLLPTKNSIDLALTKDRPTGKITLLLNGGPGMSVSPSVRMKCTLADGTVNDQNMNGGGQLTVGSTIVVQGTRDGSDHCEVWVTSGGVVYKVIDQNMSTPNPYS